MVNWQGNLAVVLGVRHERPFIKCQTTFGFYADGEIKLVEMEQPDWAVSALAATTAWVEFKVVE